MTVTYEYSTKATAMIYTTMYHCYEIDMGSRSLDELIDWAREAIIMNELEIPSKYIDCIVFVDTETGEVLAECKNREADWIGKD